MIFTAAMISDIGHVRKNNEDNYNFFGKIRENVSLSHSFYEASGDTQMSAVAVFDGMGGEASGEIASLVAAKEFHALSLDTLPENAVEQMRAANSAVVREMDKRGGVTMGCTAVALYLASGKALCLNVGDSRCYLYRNGVLDILSHDHSEAQDFIDSHDITEDEAKGRRSWHVLTRYLGGMTGAKESRPHISNFVDICEGDVFLLCTDGLTDMVSDPGIRALLTSGGDARGIAEELVDMALLAGGRDNVTVIVVKIDSLNS